MKKVISIFLILLFAFSFASWSSSSADSEYDEYDDVMAAQDWGDGYYYDSNDHAVKKTLW